MKKVLALALLCLVLCAGALADEVDVDLSLESGFYGEEISLEVSCNSNGVSVHYTLDGTLPTLDSPLYEGPIALSSTVNRPDILCQNLDTHLEENKFVPWVDFPSAHVVRAAALYEDGTVADTAAGTFFVGFDRQALYGDLPIISLIMDEKDLFDHHTGIYVLGAYHEEWHAEQEESYEAWEAQGNFSNRGMEWERPVAVDFLMPDGDSFSQNMGVRIKGGTSRSAPQKSLRLIARDEYGKKSIQYPLFEGQICQETGEILDRYKSVTLRNGGNDRDNTKIRDPYISRLAEGMNMEVAATRPAIAFINGEYWGIYTLTEEFNDNYVQHHFGIDNENVIVVKNAELKDGDEEGDDEDMFWEMFDFILFEDMADEATYAQAAEQLDMKSFADYVALNLYILNEDGIFQNNNWMLWRARDTEASQHPYADGKWRVMLFDTDYSSDVYGDGKSFSQNNIAPSLFEAEYDEAHLAALVKQLLNSEAFKNELLLSMMDVRNLYFTKERTRTMLDKMNAEFAPYVNDTYLRFGPYWVAQWSLKNHYPEKIRQLRTFFDGRYDRFLSLVANAFRMEEPVNVNLKLSDEKKGSIVMNGREDRPITQKAETKCLPEVTVTLTAIPKEGCTFRGWEVNNKHITLEDPSSPTIKVNFTHSCAIEALFE